MYYLDCREIETRAPVTANNGDLHKVSDEKEKSMLLVITGWMHTAILPISPCSHTFRTYMYSSIGDRWTQQSGTETVSWCYFIYLSSKFLILKFNLIQYHAPSTSPQIQCSLHSRMWQILSPSSGIDFNHCFQSKPISLHYNIVNIGRVFSQMEEGYYFFSSRVFLD